MFRIKATVAERAELERWVKAGTPPQGVVRRSRMILLAHQGKSSKAIGKAWKVSPPAIRLWKERFLAGGPPVLRKIAPGRGRKPSLSRRKVAAVVRATIESKPKGRTHWSGRFLAKAKRRSFKGVQRLWMQVLEISKRREVGN